MVETAETAPEYDGITLHLAQCHGVAQATDFDVEQPVIEAARKRALAFGLSDRTGFVQAAPGPLPLADIIIRDRNDGYREVARGELERLKGPLYPAVGAAHVDKNIRTWEAIEKVLDSGERRPVHLRGQKPNGIG